MTPQKQRPILLVGSPLRWASSGSSNPKALLSPNTQSLPTSKLLPRVWTLYPFLYSEPVSLSLEPYPTCQTSHSWPNPRAHIPMQNSHPCPYPTQIPIMHDELISGSTLEPPPVRSLYPLPHPIPCLSPEPALSLPPPPPQPHSRLVSQNIWLTGSSLSRPHFPNMLDTKAFTVSH